MLMTFMVNFGSPSNQNLKCGYCISHAYMVERIRPWSISMVFYFSWKPLATLTNSSAPDIHISNLCQLFGLPKLLVVLAWLFVISLRIWWTLDMGYYCWR